MSNFQRLSIAVCLVVAVFALVGPSMSATWNLAADWSGTNNPNGPWSYGYTTTVGGTFTAYSLVSANTWGNVYEVGRIRKDTGTGVVSLWSTHSEELAGRPAVARWTSPVSGTVHVWCNFSFEDTSNRRGIVYVYHNSVQKYSQLASNWDFPFCWSGDITVSEGDTIDFVVGTDPDLPYPKSVPVFDTSAIITYDPVGTVSGTVKADVSGDLPVPYAIIKTSDGKYVATSGSDGSYSISLPAGTHTLIAGTAHFISHQVDNLVVSGGSTQTVDFLLGGGIISGTVTSESGAPIAGATVRTLGEGGFSTTTDSAGVYTLKIQAGKYSRNNILVSANGFAPARSSIVVLAGNPVTRNFALKPASTGSQITLPAPLDWGEPPSAPAAPGDNFPVAFADTSALPSSDAPVIAGWNETVKPDESFTLTGARFTTRTDADMGTDTTVWVWARTSASGGVLKQAKLWKVTGEMILATMPDDIPYGAYLVWVENSEGVSSPIIINRTRTTYVGPLGNVTYPGAKIRVMGKNISHNRGLSVSDSYVYVQSASGGAFQACTVTRVDPYMVEFTLPEGLSYGDYNVFVHNGHGGIYGWSDPLEIFVEAQWVRGSAEVSLNPTNTDDTTNIQNAINTLTGYPNGGTIKLSAGTYIVTGNIKLKDNVEIKGAGMDVTFINLQMASNVNVFDLMGAHAGISDLTIREMAGYSPYGAVITYNWDLIATYSTFKRIKFTGPSGTNRIWLGRLAEISDCVIYAQLGSFSECWVHHNILKGARYNTSEAPFIAGHKRDVFEFNHIETENWPYDPTKPDPYNYKNNMPNEEWRQMCWAWRIALTYCDDLYAAHNTSKDVATQQNRGEIWLFHGQPCFWFGNVVSTEGLTVNLRTDGLVNDEVMIIKNYNTTYQTGGSMLLRGGMPVPDGTYFGPIDPMGGSDEIHADQASYKITIVSGKGMGQQRKMTAHTHSSVTVDRPWLVQPDSTSIATISQLRVDNTVYKNQMNAFPAGYNRITGAQAGYGSDGSQGVAGANLWNLSVEGNVSRRTTTGWSLGVGQTIPLCWNELRDEKAYDCAGIGYYMHTLMAEQGPGPAPICAIGNVWRGGDVTVIGGGASSVPVTGAFVENNVATAIEKASFSSKRGLSFGGINGPAPYGTTLSTSLYGSVLFRKNNVAVFNNPSLQPGEPQPVFFRSYHDGQMLSGNTYSGSAQTYFGVEAYHTPVALTTCARIKGYVGYHVDPVIVPIANAGIQNMTWSVTASHPWISATVGASPTVSAEGDSGRLIVDVDTTGMGPGKHWGYVTLSTGAKTVKVGVCVDLQSGTPSELSPIASFTATPPGGIAPVAVDFDATDSTDPDGTIVSYSWDFGDGTVASGVTASHTYSTPGTYLVTLTVTDNSGKTSIAVSPMTVGTQLSVVSISGDPAPPVESGANVTLTAVPTGGYNVSYKFLLRSGDTWSTLREYSASPTIDWTVPSESGYYAIRVLARSEGSAGAYDAVGEIVYPVGLISMEGLKLWLRGDTGVTVDETGKISSWADQSGSGNNMTQISKEKRPILVPSVFDGKPAVRFAGSEQMMQSSALVLSGNTPFTAFTAAKFNSLPSSTYQYLWWNGTDSSTAGYGCYISTLKKLRSGWGSQSFYLSDPNTVVLDEWYKMCTMYTPGSHQAWLNGALLGTSGKTGSDFNGGGGFSVGNFGPDATKGFYGDIGEIIIYNRALSDTERLAVENYLNTKWSPIPTVTVDRLTDVKFLSDQTKVSITTPKAVTVQSGIFKDNVYYISEPDRTAGMKVVGEEPVSLWENITLTGVVGTDSNEEKMLVVDTIDTRVSGEEFSPLGMLNKVVTPSGVLTRVWGRVTETGDDYFIISDGSGSPVVIDTTSLVTPVTVTIQTGQYVAATGLAGKGDGGVRVVRPRSDADIQTY